LFIASRFILFFMVTRKGLSNYPLETHAGVELRNSQTRESAARPTYKLGREGARRHALTLAVNPQMGEPRGNE
jgi:hypothetical protein